jgi:hypothetical protein
LGTEIITASKIKAKITSDASSGTVSVSASEIA